MAARSRALVGILAALTGCNEILGIEDRPLKPPATSGSATTTGSGGEGGEPGTGGGSGVLWARRFGDITPEQSFRVAVDSQGGVLVSAIFGGFLSFDRILEAAGPADGCALKLSADGEPEWSYHVGGSGTQDVGAVAFDASDVPYVSGNFSGPTDFPNYPSTSATSDFFVARIGANGEPPFTWSNGQLWDMAVHESGFSVFGTFSDTLTFAGAPPLVVTDEGKDGFAAQIATNGTAAWANKISAGASDVQIRRAARNGASTIMSAQTSAAGGPVSFLAFASNVDGSIITTPWGNVHGDVEVTDIVITPSATIVVVGSFVGSLQFDNSALVSDDQDIFFLSFQINGVSVNVLALERFGGVGRDVPRGLTVTPAGVAMTGLMSSAVSFETTANPQPLAYVGGEDAFVVELTEEGDFVKGVALGGPGNQEGRDLELDRDGNMVVTGMMEETLTIDGEVLYSGGSTDIFVAKIRW